MGIDLRYPPNIQDTALRGYLVQLIDQLQWAMGNIETMEASLTPSAQAKLSPLQTESQSSITSQDAQSVFASIKALIIKSAEIVNAYSEEISKKLVSEYEAYSDFGAFLEYVEHNIKANAEGITNSFTNIQVVTTGVSGLENTLNNTTNSLNNSIKDISGDVSDVKTDLQKAQRDLNTRIASAKNDISNAQNYIAKVDGHIKIGEVDTVNGLPIYGIEVGQTNAVEDPTTGKTTETYSKYARFTSEKLSFYNNNDDEIAYISGQQLYITDAVILGTLTLGRYLIETSHGLAFKRMGG